MKNIKKAVYTILILLLIISNVSSLGISPAYLDFGTMSRSAYSEKTILISTGGEGILNLSVSDNIRDWITIEPNETILLNGKSQVRIKVKLRIPDTATSGNYIGNIRIRFSPINKSETVMGMGIREGALVDVIVNVLGAGGIAANISGTETYIYGGNVLGIRTNNPVVGTPLYLSLNFTNTGNIRAKPSIYVDILDSIGEVLKSANYSYTEVDPKESKNIEFKVIYNNLSSGAYRANITTSVKDKIIDSRRIEFEILEELPIIRRTSTETIVIEFINVSTTAKALPEANVSIKTERREFNYLNIVIALLLILFIVIYYSARKIRGTGKGLAG